MSKEYNNTLKLFKDNGIKLNERFIPMWNYKLKFNSYARVSRSSFRNSYMWVAVYEKYHDARYSAHRYNDKGAIEITKFPSGRYTSSSYYGSSRLNVPLPKNNKELNKLDKIIKAFINLPNNFDSTNTLGNITDYNHKLPK